MASIFNVHDAAAYEQLMGRWSKRLAPKFIKFSRLAGRREGSRCRVWNRQPDLRARQIRHFKEIEAIDFSPIFVDEAIRRNTDPRIRIQQADACALPFEDCVVRRALALLVLHFIPDAGKAVAEMRRVVRPGGVVAAVVWDHYGGMPGMRMMVDTVAALSEGGRQLRSRYCFQPMMQPGEMKRTFVGTRSA